jgi:hypothetical protein
LTGSAYTILLTGGLPEATTFANHNYTLFPANSILLGFGTDFSNQTTLTSYHLETFTVPFNVEEGSWYRVSTVMSSSDYISVSLNGTQVFNVSRTAYPYLPTTSYTGPIGAFSGSFGFGAHQDHEAYFRNVQVLDTANASTIYEKSLTSSDVLVEYGTQANIESVCLDGPKRDRLVWLGDYYHTSRIIGVSTSRVDLSRGTLQFLLDSQLPNGQLSISPPMGNDPAHTLEAFYPSGEVGLDDYQILGLLAFYEHVRAHNDLNWANSTWSGWKVTANWLLGKINETDGLIYVNSAFLGGASGGSAVSCAAVQALNGLADVASALGDTTSSTTYRAAAASISTAVNTILWNDNLGIYSLSRDSPDSFLVAATAFSITSGVASDSQIARLATSIEQLRLWPGYRDSSAVNASDPAVNISPNTNGFLLSALFTANATRQAADLLVDLWGNMLPGEDGSRDATASGASWEYLYAGTGKPGLELFTSLSHPWGGAPTYVLTEWAAGLQMAEGTAGFGYKEWVVKPDTGVALGLKNASATVVTAFEGSLGVEWALDGTSMSVTVTAPTLTSGRFVYGNVSKELAGGDRYQFTVEIA